MMYDINFLRRWLKNERKKYKKKSTQNHSKVNLESTKSQPFSFCTLSLNIISFFTMKYKNKDAVSLFIIKKKDKIPILFLQIRKIIFLFSKFFLNFFLASPPPPPFFLEI